MDQLHEPHGAKELIPEGSRYVTVHRAPTWTNQFGDTGAYKWVVTLGVRREDGTGQRQEGCPGDHCRSASYPGRWVYMCAHGGS